jgi:hypothetical protein
VNNRERSARRLLRWYPRSWRATHEEEFLSLLEDSIADRPFWPGRSLNVVMNGLRLRSVELRRSPRSVMYSSGSVTVVVLVLIIGIATNGFGLFSASGPTKGGMPYDPPTGAPYDKIPDYVSVYIAPGKIGYTPKAYLAYNGATNDPLLGRVAPVYASNLTTLLGHEYPGIGFVPLGSSPWAQPCRVENVMNKTSSGTVISTIPCPATTLVLPDIDGMVTPTAVGELSGLGVSVVVVNVHSLSVPPGHIVSTSPTGGSTVHARQQVIVNNSVPG